MKLPIYNSRHSRAGFTLIEILVVLVIASILAAVTLGGYSSLRASNRRTSCQANMAQIYHAIRLYASDFDGEVPYYDPDNTFAHGEGLGLWALFTYAKGPSGANATIPADAGIKPEKRYLSNPKLFHCPSDIAGTNSQMFTDSANSVYNPKFLSYQTIDYGCVDPQDSSCSGVDSYIDNPETTVTDKFRYTYDPTRTTTIGSTWQRQLLTFDGTSKLIKRPPTDDTVVLWCPFHRGHGSVSTDNVLFWDGTIQSLPTNQNGAIGADRVPQTP